MKVKFLMVFQRKETGKIINRKRTLKGDGFSRLCRKAEKIFFNDYPDSLHPLKISNEFVSWN